MPLQSAIDVSAAVRNLQGSAMCLKSAGRKKKMKQYLHVLVKALHWKTVSSLTMIIMETAGRKTHDSYEAHTNTPTDI